MNVQRTILQNLSNRHPGMMATSTLWSEVRMDLGAEVTYTQFKKALEDLEQLGQIVVIPGQDRAKAKITAEGLARLAE